MISKELNDKVKELNLTKEQIELLGKDKDPNDFLDSLDDTQLRAYIELTKTDEWKALLKEQKEKKTLAYWVGQITSIVVLLCILTLICGIAIFATLKILGWMFPYLGAKMMFW